MTRFSSYFDDMMHYVHRYFVHLIWGTWSLSKFEQAPSAMSSSTVRRGPYAQRDMAQNTKLW